MILIKNRAGLVIPIKPDVYARNKEKYEADGWKKAEPMEVKKLGNRPVEVKKKD
jgi:hypothetical protein